MRKTFFSCEMKFPLARISSFSIPSIITLFLTNRLLITYEKYDYNIIAKQTMRYNRTHMAQNTFSLQPKIIFYFLVNREKQIQICKANKGSLCVLINSFLQFNPIFKEKPTRVCKSTNEMPSSVSVGRAISFLVCTQCLTTSKT